MQRCESFKSILYNHIVAMSPPPLTQTNIVAVLSLSFHLPLTCHHLLNINSLHVSSDCMRHYRSHVQRWSQSRKCKKQNIGIDTVLYVLLCFVFVTAGTESFFSCVLAICPTTRFIFADLASPWRVTGPSPVSYFFLHWNMNK